MQVTDKIQITNEDNMALMARYPDKYFDLAIVDPPYGINWDGDNDVTKKGRPDNLNRKENPKYDKKNWDNSIPRLEYFNELKRVSKNQIVWGGNYMTEFLNPSRCWIFWDKLYDNTFNFSHGELAWTSFERRMLKVVMSSKIESCGGLNKIHPCQKPPKLYKWLLKHFAKQGDKILDTHLGSGSIAIACHDYGFELTACELDKDYYEAAIKRIKQHVSQLTILQE